jgi:hypothetical protein
MLAAFLLAREVRTLERCPARCRIREEQIILAAEITVEGTDFA